MSGALPTYVSTKDSRLAVPYAISAEAGLSAPLLRTMALGDNSPRAATTAFVANALNDRTPDLRDFSLGYDGTGANDMTSNVQTFFNQCIASGYEGHIPAGTFTTTSTINAIGRFNIRCDEAETIVNTTTSGFAQHGGGTWFHLAHAGRGFYLANNGPAGLPFSYGSKFHGLGTYRDQPASKANWTPGAFDFDIYAYGTELDLAATLLNPTKGVCLDTCGKAHMRQLKGQPLQMGLQVLDNYDIIYGDKIFFWPFASFDPNIYNYMQLNAIALETARADGLALKHVFALGYGTCWHITDYNPPSGSGAPPGTTYLGSIDTLYCDTCVQGIVCDATTGGTLFVGNFYAQPTTSFVGLPTRGIIIGGGSGQTSGQVTNTQLNIDHAFIAECGAQLALASGGGASLNINRLLAGRYNLSSTSSSPMVYGGVDVSNGGTATVGSYVPETQLVQQRANTSQPIPGAMFAAGASCATCPSTNVAGLVPNSGNGSRCYVTDARKAGEAAGFGTGVLAYFSNGAWRRPSDDSAVAA